MTVDDIKTDLERAKVLMMQGKAGFEEAAESGAQGAALALQTVHDSSDDDVEKAAAALQAADDEVDRVLNRVNAAVELADAYRDSL